MHERSDHKQPFLGATRTPMAGIRSNGLRHRPAARRVAGGLVAGAASAMLAFGVIAAAGSADTSPREAASAAAQRFVATDIPDSPVGRQTRWLIDASARVPLGDVHLRGHVSTRFATSGEPGARSRELLGELNAAGGLRLVGLTVAQPAALTATVLDGCARRLVLAVSVDRAGRIDNVTLGPAIASPRPSGRAGVGDGMG